MENDYRDQAGVLHANKLKDLARLTLRFQSPTKLAQTLRELHTLGVKITILKVLRVPATCGFAACSDPPCAVLIPPVCGCSQNKYANPTPLGYCARTLPR